MMTIDESNTCAHSLKFFGIVVLMILISSCVTTKKTTYLQTYDTPNDSIYLPAIPQTYRVQAYDNLYIRVITPDPRWSTMFNTMPINSTSMSGEAAIDLISYSVQLDGIIDVPFVGSIEVAGYTLTEITEIVEEELSDYITDAAITVKLVNNYVSVLGDVTRPGLYPIYKEQMNIFQALSMAGDLDDFGNRRSVQIIRHTTEGSVVKAFDLTNRNIIDSEFYYVKPNDVIYVEPMKGKFFNMNSFPFALILTSITTFLLLLNYIQY